jgi:hypothetical protein
MARHQQRFSSKIATEIAAAKEWWVGEGYHQQYLAEEHGHSTEKGSLAPIQCYGDRGPIKKLEKLSERAIAVLKGRKKNREKKDEV